MTLADGDAIVDEDEDEDEDDIDVDDRMMMIMTMMTMRLKIILTMTMLELTRRHEVYETCLPSVVGPSEGASVVPGLVK